MAKHEQFDEQELAVARVYARALLELAEKHHEQAAVLEEFETMIEHFDLQPRFEQLRGDPGVDEAERASILERVLRDRANDLVVNTLQVMNRKGRSALFRPLVEAYREELARLGGVLAAAVTTAVPLGEGARERLTASLARYTGKKIELEESVDESLVGGMILRIGDQKIDSSVARELWRVGVRLKERASEELHAGAVVER